MFYKVLINYENMNLLFLLCFFIQVSLGQAARFLLKSYYYEGENTVSVIETYNLTRLFDYLEDSVSL